MIKSSKRLDFGVGDLSLSTTNPHLARQAAREGRRVVIFGAVKGKFPAFQELFRDKLF